MTGDDFIREFRLIIDSPNGVQKLREMILQLAVRGNLVPQDPNDEPVSVLMEKIVEEKTKLIRLGKIRESKPLPQIEVDNAPYELPKGWQWHQLGDYVLIEMGQSPPSSTYNVQGEGLPFYQGKADFGALHPIPSKWCSEPQKIALPFDIVISVRAPVGPTNIVLETSCIGRGLAALRSIGKGNYMYLLYFLRANEYDIASKGVGSTFTAISRKDLDRLQLPIPPIAEQKRIVAKVDELMRLCHELEARQKEKKEKSITLNASCLNALLDVKQENRSNGNHTRIFNNFDLLYDNPENVTELRKAILQLAVQGRLVPQYPNDESASVLLERISAEKNKLIEEGKIKREMLFLPVDQSEKLDELPVNWVLSHMDTLSKKIHYGYTASSDSSITSVRLLRITDIQYDRVKWESVPGCVIDDNSAQKYELSEGDLLIARTGGTIGKSYLVSALNIRAVFASYLIRIIPSKHVSPLYLKIFLGSRLYWSQLYKKAKGTGQPNVNSTSLKSLLVPLPPFAEQERIVDKVNKLMNLLDELETRLRKSLSESESLMEAVAYHLCS